MPSKSLIQAGHLIDIPKTELSPMIPSFNEETMKPQPRR
jgi:hypothetical protein